MKTTLFYFSGSGNSLKIAEDLGSKLEKAKVVSIPKVIKKKIDVSSDCIGILFPVYIWGPPLIIGEFIKKIKFAKDKYIFVVVTYGGMPGGIILKTASIMKKAGLTLSAGFKIQMPGNYTPMYGAIPAKK